MRKDMGRNRKTYTDEFRKKCIQELMEGKSASEVCADNSISLSTLSDWKKAFLDNGFDNEELNKIKKRQQETEAKLEAVMLLIRQKELEIELLKKEQRF